MIRQSGADPTPLRKARRGYASGRVYEKRGRGIGKAEGGGEPLCKGLYDKGFLRSAKPLFCVRNENPAKGDHPPLPWLPHPPTLGSFEKRLVCGMFRSSIYRHSRAPPPPNPNLKKPLAQSRLCRCTEPRPYHPLEVRFCTLALLLYPLSALRFFPVVRTILPLLATEEQPPSCPSHPAFVL